MVGVRIWSSLCDWEVDELIYKNDFVVPDGKVSDAKFMKQSSGGRETETLNTLDIRGCSQTSRLLEGEGGVSQNITESQKGGRGVKQNITASQHIEKKENL